LIRKENSIMSENTPAPARFCVRQPEALECGDKICPVCGQPIKVGYAPRLTICLDGSAPVCADCVKAHSAAMRLVGVLELAAAAHAYLAYQGFVDTVEEKGGQVHVV
jgi:hypothetical protein